MFAILSNDNYSYLAVISYLEETTMTYFIDAWLDRPQPYPAHY